MRGSAGRPYGYESYTKADVLKLFGEVSDSLHRAYIVGKASAVSPLRLEQLRRVWSDNTGRLSKYQEEHDIKPDAPDDLADKLNEITGRVCRCQT